MLCYKSTTSIISNVGKLSLTYNIAIYKKKKKIKQKNGFYVLNFFGYAIL